MEKDMKNKKAFGVKKNPHWCEADGTYWLNGNVGSE